MFKVVAVGLLVAIPSFGWMNASGTWKAAMIDEIPQKPCNAVFKIEQTETKISITERVYECQDNYSLKQVAIEADIVAVNETVQKLVSKGKVIGILQDAQIQITVSAENGEALLLTPGATNKQIKVREMLGTGETKSVLAGIGMKQGELDLVY